MNYALLVKNLLKIRLRSDNGAQRFKLSINDKYAVIKFLSDENFHVTIFKDQWDDYHKKTGHNYHLFHISSESETTKCSSYFWATTAKLKILSIPKNIFAYGQENFGLYSSTRQPCDMKSIAPTMRKLQVLMHDVMLLHIKL